MPSWPYAGQNIPLLYHFLVACCAAIVRLEHCPLVSAVTPNNKVAEVAICNGTAFQKSVHAELRVPYRTWTLSIM